MNNFSKHQIHVFISHSWKYSQHYEKLSEWIFQEKWHVNGTPLDMRDYSVPKSDPIVGAKNDQQLRDEIYTQMRLSHVIVIPTGMYATHSKWIQKEIDGARLYKKPIIAVELRGSQKSASVVISAANECVGWTKKSVMGAIWKLYSAHKVSN